MRPSLTAWLVLALLLSSLVGGCGGGPASSSPSLCGEEIEGRWGFLQYDYPAYGEFIVRLDGRYEMVSTEWRVDGGMSEVVVSEGRWEYLSGCEVVKAWNSTPEVFFLINLSSDRRSAAFTGVSESPSYLLGGRRESGVMFKR